MSTLRELELVQASPRLLEVLRRQGIASLTGFQRDAVERGITRGKSQILVTYDYEEAYEIAEIAILNRAASDFKARVMVVCPNPHHAEKRFQRIGQRCHRLGIETSLIMRRRMATRPRLKLGRVIIVTFNSLRILLQTSPEILDDLQSVLVERLDLIGQQEIGAYLEKSLVTIKGQKPDIQYISVCPPFLDIDEMSAWLKSEVVNDKRADIERIFSVKTFENAFESLTDLTEFVLEKRGQVMLLCPGREASEKFATMLVDGYEESGRLDPRLTLGHQDELLQLSRELVKHHPKCGLTRLLARLVRRGVAFIHRGVSRAQRREITKAWESGLLLVVTMPTSFAIGSGLKASTVFVMGVYMQATPVSTTEDLILVTEWQLSEVLQAAGRSGIDNRAFGIVVVDNEAEQQRVISKYFQTLPNRGIIPRLGEVDSSMDDPENVQDLVLGELCSRAETGEDPFSVLSRTFWAFSKDNVLAASDGKSGESERTIEAHITRRAVKSTIARANEIPDSSVKLVSVTPHKIEGLIHSASRDLWHHVILRDDEGLSCTCESWKYQGIKRHRLCKHLVKFMRYAARKEGVSQYASSVIRQALAGLEILDELVRDGLVAREEKGFRCTDLGRAVTALGIPMKDAKRVMKALAGDRANLSEILLDIAGARSSEGREIWQQVIKLVELKEVKEIEFCENDIPGVMENCFEDLQYLNVILLGLIGEGKDPLRKDAEIMDKKLNAILDAFS
jgi:hypothetical protein